MKNCVGKASGTSSNLSNKGNCSFSRIGIGRMLCERPMAGSEEGNKATDLHKHTRC